MADGRHLENRLIDIETSSSFDEIWYKNTDLELCDSLAANYKNC